MGEDTRREWAKCLPPLDVTVEPVAGSRIARVRDDAAIAEGPGAELAAALEPAPDKAVGKQGGDGGGDVWRSFNRNVS